MNTHPINYIGNTTTNIPSLKYMKHFNRLYSLAHTVWGAWNNRLKLDCYFNISSLGKDEDGKDIFGQYRYLGRINKSKDRYGEIIIDVAKHVDLYYNMPFEVDARIYDLEITNTVKHEIAHAIADLRYNAVCGHNEPWLTIGKLMRVDIRHYCKHAA